jgi:hypothetical protein
MPWAAKTRRMPKNMPVQAAMRLRNGKLRAKMPHEITFAFLAM